MRLLIADFLRRQNVWMMLCLAVALPFTWWIKAAARQQGRAFAFSMALAFVLGPRMGQYVPRVIWYLPVSRREIWRAGWIVGTVGTIAFTFAAKTLAFAAPSVRHAIGPMDLLLSTVYDVTAIGLAFSLVVIATRPRPAHGPLRRPWPVLKGIAEVALPLGLFAGVYGPMWLDFTPPARWTDLPGYAGVLLVAGFALTIATYFHSPLAPTSTPASRTIRPSPSRTAVRRPARLALTGLPRLLLHEYAWTTLIGGGLALAAAAVVIVMAGVVHEPADLVEFLASALREIDGNGSSPLDGGLSTFNLLLWYALFASTLAARFPAMIRHLRVLPLGATRLNALLLAWPAFFWLSVWLALALLHYALLGTGLPSLHVQVFVALVGLSALLQSVTLRVNGVVKGLVFVASAALAPLLYLVPAWPPPLLVLLGAGTLAAAAFINRQALFVGSTYRRPPDALPISQN